MRWLAFGTYDVAHHPRVGVLIEGIRTAGDDLIEVNVPLALDTAARVAMLRQPWRLPVLAAKLARCWALLTVRSWRLRRMAGIDAVLVGYLGHFDVRLARRLFPRTVIVLDHLVSAAGTASDRGLAAGGGVKARLMRAIDDGALRSADVVVVDTPEHAAALPPRAAGRGVVAPVGAGAAWYAAGAAAATQRASAAATQRASPSARTRARLRVVFVGLFTPLHGAPTLGAALAELAVEERIEVTVVGTGQDYEACRRAAAANPRVRWVNWVRGDDLPALVAGHDVCLGIFGTTDKARNVVPTKVFQGAAAGCAIVTSDTPPQRDALGDAALYVAAGDAGALAAALRRLAADPDELARLRHGAAERAADRFRAGAVVEPVRERVASARAQDPMARSEHRSRPRGRRMTSQPNPPLPPRAALRWSVVRPIVADLRPATILELGCGLGAVGVRLARMGAYTAVEPDERSWEVARARIAPLGATVIHGDHNKAPAGADLVCAFEVLEHIADDAAALAEWLPLVRPGGHLLLSVPADPERFGEWDELVGHYRRYTREQLHRRLVDAGAVDVQVVHYGWPLGYLLDTVKDRLVRSRTGDGAYSPRGDGARTAEERTQSSGRLLQPRRSLTGGLVHVGVAPFAALQRLRPGKGPGLVALAARPND